MQIIKNSRYTISIVSEKKIQNSIDCSEIKILNEATASTTTTATGIFSSALPYPRQPPALSFPRPTQAQIRAAQSFRRLAAIPYANPTDDAFRVNLNAHAIVLEEQRQKRRIKEGKGFTIVDIVVSDPIFAD